MQHRVPTCRPLGVRVRALRPAWAWVGEGVRVRVCRPAWARGWPSTSTWWLEQRLTTFIDYFNSVLAKPFRWTYAGRPLRAT